MLSRAASRAATTVEEEVTFCKGLADLLSITRQFCHTYYGRDSKSVLLSVVKELENIIANDNTTLAAENVLAPMIESVKVDEKHVDYVMLEDCRESVGS